MSRGLAYDSDEGRDYAAALTAIMHGEAYRQSASSPATTAARSRVPEERAAVPAGHRASIATPRTTIPTGRRPGRHARRGSIESGTRRSSSAGQHGYRNAQVTVLAPTGTIAFMMDCDTTGIEPDIALIKYKKLVGEGFLKIVNQTVPAALRSSATAPEQVEEILAYINERETIEGAPHAQARAPVGLRLRVQAGQRRAVDPLHGPRPDDGRGPAVPVRRDQQDRQHARGRHGRGDRAGLPRGLEARPQGDRDLPRRLEAQPAAVAPARRRTATRSPTPRRSPSSKRQLAAAQAEAGKPHRRRLPAERTAVTHKFDIAGHEGYITVGLYPDGQPGEIFLKMAKEGSTVSGPDGHLRDDRVAWRSSTACRCATSSTSSPTSGSSRAASPATRRSRSPSRSWTTSSAGSGRGSCKDEDKAKLGLIDRSAVVRMRRPSAAPRSVAGSGPPPLPWHPPPRGPLLHRRGGLERRHGGSPAVAPSPTRRPTPPRRPPSRPNPPSSRRRRRLEPLAVIATNGHANGHVDQRQRRTASRPRSPCPWARPRSRSQIQEDAPSCAECGSIMVRNGSCYKCLNCGSTSGCS